MRKTIIAALSCFLTASCSTGFNVKQYTPGTDAKGIVYSLPKHDLYIETKLTVSGKYFYRDKAGSNAVIEKLCAVSDISRINECEWDDDFKIKVDSVTLKSVVLPDPAASFVIDSENYVDAEFFANKFTSELSEDGYLTKSTAQNKNQTIDFLKGTVEFAAKLITPAGPVDSDADISAVVISKNETIKRYKDAYAELEELYFKSLPKDGLSEEEQKKANTERGFVKKAMEELEAKITSETQSLKTVSTVTIPEMSVTFSCTIPLVPGTASYTVIRDGDGACKAFESAKEMIANHISGSVGAVTSKVNNKLNSKGMPSELILTLDDANKANVTTVMSDSKSTYYYRIPHKTAYELSYKIDGSPIPAAKGETKIAQFGNIGQIPVISKAFSSVSTEVQLWDTTGGVKLYTSDASTSDSATTLFTNLDSIRTAIESTDEDKTELDELLEQNTLLDAKINNLEKTIKLEGLENANEDEAETE